MYHMWFKAITNYVCWHAVSFIDRPNTLFRENPSVVLFVPSFQFLALSRRQISKLPNPREGRTGSR